MDHELLPGVCAALVALFWGGSVVWFLAHGRGLAQRLNREARKVAESLGLTMGSDLRATGAVEGVKVTLAPAKVRYLGTEGGTSYTAVHRVVVARDGDAPLAVCERAYRSRYVEPEIPDLAEQPPTGDSAFDKKYVVLAASEPDFPFWTDPAVLRSALELSLNVVVAREGELEASYATARVGGKKGGYGEPSSVRRAVYTTLAMTSADRAMLYRPQLEEPLRPPPSSPPAPLAVVASVAAGVAGAFLLDYPDEWMGFVVGFAFAFPPFLLLFLLVDAVARWRRRMPEAGSDETDPGSPYR